MSISIFALIMYAFFGWGLIFLILAVCGALGILNDKQRKDGE